MSVSKEQSRSCKGDIKKLLPHSIVSKGPAQIQCGKRRTGELTNRRCGSLGGPLWRLATILGCSLTITWRECPPNGYLVILKREVNIVVSFHEFSILMEAIIIISPQACHVISTILT